MAESPIDALTVRYFEDGVETVKEIDKVILTRGAWCTIIFRFQNLDRQTGEYGSDKYTIRRYQKRQDEYFMKSKFNISSPEQAQKIIDALSGWISRA